MKIILNGGHFGGHTIEVKTTTKPIEMKDERGGVWVYSYGLNGDNTATAEFVGMKA